VPHAPSGSLAADLPLPVLTAKTETSFSRSLLLHEGQDGLAVPKTIFSNRWEHFRQEYS